MTCPNKNTPEWRNLVKLFGETNAMLAFMRNGDRMPTILEATKLLNNNRININKRVNSSLRKKVAKEIIDNLNKEANPIEAIEKLIISNSNDEAFKSLYNMLKAPLIDHLGNSKFLGFRSDLSEDSAASIVFVEENGQEGYVINLTTGIFQDSNEFYNDLSYVLLHELVHVVTIFPIIAQVANNRGFALTLPKKMQENIKELKSLFSYVKEIAPQNILEEYSHAFRDEKEFVAFALTNKDFAEFLNSVKYRETSILKRILRILKNIFVTPIPGSALDEVMYLVDDLILSQKGNTNIVNQIYNLDNKNSLLGEVLLKEYKGVTSDENKFYEENGVKKLRTSTVIEEFSPFARRQKNTDYYKNKATAIFKANGVAPDGVLEIKGVGNIVTPYSLEEYADKLKINENKGRLEGKAIHAWYVAEKLKSIGENARASEYYNEFDKNVRELNLDTLGIEELKKRSKGVDELLAEEFLGLTSVTQYEFQLDLALKEFEKEGIKVNGIAGTADIIVDQGNNVYGLYDIKTGKKLESAKIQDITLLDYARETETYLEDDPKSRYAISMALYALMIKMQNPKAKFSAIKLLHIGKDSTEAVMPDLGSGLALLAGYFKKNHNEFYEKNKQLFSPKNYVTSTSDVNVKLSNQSKSIFKQNTVVRFREVVRLKSELEKVKPSARTEKQKKLYDEILEEHQELVEILVSLEVGAEPFKEQGFKNLNFIQALFLNRYNSKNSLIRSLNDIYAKRKVAFDKEILRYKKSYRGYIEKVLKEGGYNSSTMLVGSSYKEIFDFMWDNGDMTTYLSKKWQSLTESQKKYADFHRRILRFNLFATMNPIEGVGHIEKELSSRKDLTAEDIALLKKQKDILNNLPNYNKSLDYKELSRFNYYEGWTPRMDKRPEEVTLNKKGISEYIKANLRKGEILTDRDFMNTILPKEYQTSTGIDPKFFRPSQDNADLQIQGEYTWNTEFIFDGFMANMLSKRYFDDVYNIGLGIKHYMLQDDLYNNRRANRHNIMYLDSFLKGTILKKPTDIFNMTVKMFGYEFKLDALTRRLRSYFGVTTLAFNILGAATAGINQTIRTIIQAIAGSATKLFLGADAEKDMTSRDMLGAFGKILEWKRAQLPHKLKKDDLLLDNKLHLMLQEWDYLPKSYIYEDAYSAGGVSAKGLILPTWVNNELLLKLYSSVDNINYATYLVGQLMHQKVNKTIDGVTKKVSMWDAYEVKDGELVYTGDARGIDKSTGDIVSGLTFREIDKLRGFAERDLGSYRSDERSYMDNSTLGAMFMMFKRWMPAMVKRAFSGSFENYTLGEYMNTKNTVTDIDGVELPELEWVARSDEGYVRTLLRSVAVLKLFNKDIEKNGRFNSDYGKLSIEQKKNVIYAITKAASFVSLYLMFLALYGEDVDDDDRNALKRAASRIRDETVMEFVIFPGAGSIEDWKRQATSFAALDKAASTTEGYIDFIFGGILQGDILGIEGHRIQSGPHKGWYKGMVPAIRGTKYVSTIFGLAEFITAYEDIDDTLVRLQ